MRRWFLTAFLCITSSLCLAADSRSTLHGRVLDSQGKPIAHATVMVYVAGVKVGYSTFCPSCYRDCGRRVTTDDKGSFSLQGLAPDLWFKLLAVHEGYLPAISPKLDPADTTERTITLASRQAAEDLSTAKAHVTDAAGTPVRDAVAEPVGLIMDISRIDPTRTGLASLYGTVQGLDPLAVTNTHGDFELSYTGNSPAMLIRVEGRGFAPKFVKLETGSVPHNIVLSEGATIRGVLMAGNKPVGNAEVGLIPKSRGGYGDKLTIVGDPYQEERIGTAPDGSFLLSNVPEPVTWLLYGKMSSMPSGEGTQPVEIRTDRDGQYLDKVQLMAEPTHVLSGKVTLSDGHLIPDGMRLILSSNRIWDAQTVMLNKDGSFVVTNVPDGDFCIVPAVKGYVTRGDQHSNCHVPVSVKGKDKRDISVLLYPRPAGS